MTAALARSMYGSLDDGSARKRFDQRRQHVIVHERDDAGIEFSLDPFHPIGDDERPAWPRRHTADWTRNPFAAMSGQWSLSTIDAAE